MSQQNFYGGQYTDHTPVGFGADRTPVMFDSNFLTKELSKADLGFSKESRFDVEADPDFKV